MVRKKMIEPTIEPPIPLARLRELFEAEGEDCIAAGTPRCFSEPELFDPANWAEGEVRGDPKIVAKFRKAAQAEAAKKPAKKRTKS